jgi:hypothetical protein
MPESFLVNGQRDESDLRTPLYGFFDNCREVAAFQDGCRGIGNEIEGVINFHPGLIKKHVKRGIR